MIYYTSTQLVINMQTELSQVLESIAELKAEFVNLEAKFSRSDSKTDTFNEKFDNYQKATQSLVSLAFGLIASATLITIVSTIFKVKG
jgi:predicted nuclease with TOPRIM domain